MTTPAPCPPPDPGATVTPELDALAALAHAHQQRRSNGSLPAWGRLDGGSRMAWRNLVAVLVDELTVERLTAIKEERRRHVEA